MATAQRATTSFFATVGDEEVIVYAGEVFASDDPVVAAHPELFAPAVLLTGGSVEQATAAPGEKRNR